MAKHRLWHLLLAVAIMLPSLIGTQTSAEIDTLALPAWLEPRGLSVVELVGQVPEVYLHGVIISYADNNGIVVYESGTRTGRSVVLTTTIYPRFSTPDWAEDRMLTSFGCLGQIPHYDHMGSVVPESILRLYDGRGVEVTSRIRTMFISRMGTRQPATNSREYDRYPPWYSYGRGGTYPLPIGPQGLTIPVNSGCNILIQGENYASLTGVFTLTLDPLAQASVLGVQSGTFRSYIGPGEVGIFQPLMDQMRARYPDRDTRIQLSPPAGAEHFLLKFPPMPGDAYRDRAIGPPYPNADRPTGGTYRLVRNTLSTNLVFSAAFPLLVAWRDADLAPGSAFLPLITHPPELGAPEYVLPAGIPYNACFTRGDCSDQILQQIYNATMTLQIIYLSVNRPPTGVQWTPLRMAGPAWAPSALGSSSTTLSSPSQPIGPADPPPRTSASSTAAYWLYLPFVSRVDETTGCPCGWFDADGRMLDYVPGP